MFFDVYKCVNKIYVVEGGVWIRFSDLFLTGTIRLRIYERENKGQKVLRLRMVNIFTTKGCEVDVEEVEMTLNIVPCFFFFFYQVRERERE